MIKSKIIFIFVILIWYSLSGYGDVQIIRKVPLSGENQTTAHWGNPLPDPAKEVLGPELELSGHLSAGGTTGFDAAGNQFWDAATDSSLALLQSLGPSAYLQISALVIRKNSIDKVMQQYVSDIKLGLDKTEFMLKGSYNDNDTHTGVYQTYDRTLLIDTTMSTSLLETLPVTFSGNYTWNYLEQDSITIGDKNNANLQLSAEGTIGPVGLHTVSHVDYSDNIPAETATFGGGGSLTLIFPVISMFAVEGSIAPLYNRTEYKASDSFIESTNLDSSLGGIITFTENIIGKIGGRTTQTWTDSTISSPEEEEPYSWSLGGFLDLDIQKMSGFYIHPAYSINQEISGNSSHTLDTSLGWENEKETGVKYARSSGRWLYTQNEDDTILVNDLNWEVSLLVLPIKEINLTGSYKGTWRDPVINEQTSHAIESHFSHKLLRSLTYEAGGKWTMSEINASDRFVQDYSGSLILTPLFSDKMYTLRLSETMSISQEQEMDNYISQAKGDLLLPLMDFLQFHYSLTWEWIYHITPDGPEGNQFSHAPGFIVSGNTIPFSLITDYSLTHGYRGDRHDILTHVKVPFTGGFSMEGDFQWSYYRENDEDVMPYLFSLNGLYEF
ncbi:MAG: hypothetical protein JXJ04_09240 [Spirochaetales bacterium]|nr:hypothetical protein [Spirochaetales bacterium]